MSNQIIKGRISVPVIKNVVNTLKIHGRISFHTVTILPDAYAGEYEVTPDFETQTLETAKKSMAKDVTIFPIPVYRTTNMTGGKTVFIGGILDG